MARHVAHSIISKCGGDRTVTGRGPAQSQKRHVQANCRTVFGDKPMLILRVRARPLPHSLEEPWQLPWRSALDPRSVLHKSL